MRSKEIQGMVLPVLAGQPGDVSSQCLNTKAISHLEERCAQRWESCVRTLNKFLFERIEILKACELPRKTSTQNQSSATSCIYGSEC